MINEREEAVNQISQSVAILKYDIEHRQSMNNQSLNLFGENYFRDILNFVYGYKLQNANQIAPNFPYIDLIDNENRILIQVTSTNTAEKIRNTAKILHDPLYREYRLKIFYLLEKANPSSKVVLEIEGEYGIALKDCLMDTNSLMKDIECLEGERLIELRDLYFQKQSARYTDKKILNLVIGHLVRTSDHVTNYPNDDFGNLETDKKLKLNRVNRRISSYINMGLDYSHLIGDVDGAPDTIEELRLLVVEDFYLKILVRAFHGKIKKKELETPTVEWLHSQVDEYEIDMNVVIMKLYDKIQAVSKIKDFNMINVNWSIIAFFFELCDIGRSE